MSSGSPLQDESPLFPAEPDLRKTTSLPLRRTGQEITAVSRPQAESSDGISGRGSPPAPLSPQGLCIFPLSGAKGGLGRAGFSSWVHSGR